MGHTSASKKFVEDMVFVRRQPVPATTLVSLSRLVRNLFCSSTPIEVDQLLRCR
jgi:hypothetical protein